MSADPAVSVEVRRIPRTLGLGSLVFIMFFTVSGGAYGLEDTIGEAGAGMGLLLILIAPIVWAIPAALVVAELATAMPVQGGYYYWVKKALGPFWGFWKGGGAGSAPGSTWPSTRCCSSSTPPISSPTPSATRGATWRDGFWGLR